MQRQTYNVDMDAVERKLVSLSANKFWAESSVVVASTLSSSWMNRDKYHIKLPVLHFKKSKKSNLLFKLSIISWYMNPELGFVIREAIQPYVQNDIDLIHIKFSLYSKDWMLRVLKDELSTLHPNQVFGNFLNETEWNDSFFYSSIAIRKRKVYNIEWLPKNVKPKKTIGVGYNDKGTLPESWKPKTNDYQDDVLHELILLRREAYSITEFKYSEYLLSS